MVFVSRKGDYSTTDDDFEIGYNACEPTKIEVTHVFKLFVERNMIIDVPLNKTTHKQLHKIKKKWFQFYCVHHHLIKKYLRVIFVDLAAAFNSIPNQLLTLLSLILLPRQV